MRVITPVGTSIFDNYLDESNDIITHYKSIKEQSHKEWDKYTERCQRIKERVIRWAKGKIDASAEVKTINKLQQATKQRLEVFLIASDTITSRLSAEIVKDLFMDCDEIGIHFNPAQDIIKGLQVKESESFNEGLVNLINRIYQIAGNYWGGIVINITGGYKATIPYLTILAQVNRCPIYYIFEDTDTLIRIPYIPVDIKWRIFERNKEFFRRLEREKVAELPGGLSEEERRETLSLLEEAAPLYCFNPLGVTLWERYKQTCLFFHVSRIDREYIRNKQWKEIFENTLIELKKRLSSNSSDPDLDHRIHNWDPPENFKVFKHKEENLQVRVLYRVDEWTTRYGGKEQDIYIGLIRIGSDVHNTENEYIEAFKRDSEKILDLDNYEFYEIRQEVRNV